MTPEERARELRAAIARNRAALEAAWEERDRARKLHQENCNMLAARVAHQTKMLHEVEALIRRTENPPKNIELAERNRAIWLMRGQGATFNAVGRRFGLSGARVRGICAKINRQIRSEIYGNWIGKDKPLVKRNGDPVLNMWLVFENDETDEGRLVEIQDDNRVRMGWFEPREYGDEWEEIKK